MKHMLYLVIIGISIDHLFENNTRKMYYFINSFTKTKSVICPTLPNCILCYHFYIFF